MFESLFCFDLKYVFYKYKFTNYQGLVCKVNVKIDSKGF